MGCRVVKGLEVVRSHGVGDKWVEGSSESKGWRVDRGPGARMKGLGLSLCPRVG